MSTEDGLGLISSMATRQLLARLAEDYRAATGQAVTIESVGGVDAARRVADGEAFDLVVLADAALAKLAAGGHLDGAGRVAIARSEVAVAVREDAPHPAIDSGAAVREAVLRARSIGYSTGPSGTHLEAIVRAMGHRRDDRLAHRARPAGRAGGRADRGRARSSWVSSSAGELLDQPAIAIVGPLPDEVQAVTVFAGAVGSLCTRREAAAAFLACPRLAPSRGRQARLRDVAGLSRARSRSQVARPVRDRADRLEQAAAGGEGPTHPARRMMPIAARVPASSIGSAFTSPLRSSRVILALREPPPASPSAPAGRARSSNSPVSTLGTGPRPGPPSRSGGEQRARGRVAGAAVSIGAGQRGQRDAPLGGQRMIGCRR